MTAASGEEERVMQGGHLARVVITAGALLGGFGVARAGGTAGPAPACVLKIDRQPLDGALQQLARQCGLQIVFFSSVTDGIAAPALEGERTLDAAMGELLAGSGLSFRVLNDQTVEVRPRRMTAAGRSPDDAARAQTPLVAAAARGVSQDTAALEEVVVVGLAEQLVATRIATPLREIPQTITIVTREQIRLQDSFELAGVLDYAPGVTTIRGSSIDRSFYSRGYSIDSYHVDGGAALNPEMVVSVPLRGTPDLSEFDHVEILRGADSLFGGNAEPGGTVSLVRKRPQHHFATQLTATTGSWGDRRFEIDVTGPLAFDGALRGRADVVYDRDGYFFDLDAHERKKLFAAIDYDFSQRATLTVGGSFQRDAGPILEGGVPMYQDGSDSRLPRGTTLSFDWSGYENRLAEVYLQYRQELSDDWAVKVNTAGWRGQVEVASGEFMDTIRLSNETLSGPDAWFTTRPNEYSQATADITFTGAFDWFGLPSEIAFGGDFTRTLTEIHGVEYWDFGQPVSGVESFDPADYPDPRIDGIETLRGGGTQSLNQFGVFTSLRVQFGDWSVIGGARLNRSKTNSTVWLEVVPLPPFDWSSSYTLDPEVTPYVGVMYALNQHYSVYASYAEIHEGFGYNRRRSGGRLGPTQGLNAEAGIKGEWRDGALTGSLVAYRAEQRNAPVVDGEIFANAPEDLECCYLARSSNSSGIDIELRGALASGWQIGAGYTFNVNEAPEGGPLTSFTPRHLFKAWTNVRLPAGLRRWEFGGSLHAQSRTTTRKVACVSRGGAPCRDEVLEGEQRSYAVLDLRLGFEVSENWEVALKLDNASDKIYYESFESGDFHGWYGEPRNWTLRIDGRF